MKQLRKLPVVAIVGRTNVGKSSLFNAILGRKLAVVKDEPGVTRDRNYALVTKRAFPFTLVDTGGLVGEDNNPFQEAVREQTEIAIEEADAIIAVFDGLHGVHPLDREVVSRLRQSGKPIIWTANKCEKKETELVAAEMYSLGLDKVIFVAAAHNMGLGVLMAELASVLKLDDEHVTFEEPDPADKPLRVAVLGKPNVGKSSLINRIVGANRVVTSDIAGTTRDSVDVEVVRDGQKFIFVDTAGMRKKARVLDGSPERMSNVLSMHSLVNSDVALLVLDATEGLPSDQDKTLAQHIDDRGHGIIIVVNKWDAVEKDNTSVKEYSELIYGSMPFLRYAPILYVSALTGKRCPSILEKAKEVYQAAQKRIPTAELNSIVSRALMRRKPPIYRTEPVKVYFATQIASAPPTIVLFSNQPRKLNSGYQRYLVHEIREKYPFEGSAIRLVLRKKSEKSERKGEDRKGKERAKERR